MAIMTNKQFAEKAIDIAKNYKTIYVLGCFGAPLKASNYNRYINNYSYNYGRRSMIKAACDTKPATFGFDCVCLIKGILWGWNGDSNANYGGAQYAANGVQDMGEDVMITKCSGLSKDFSKIEVGEAVWMSGHIGIYVGDGLAVECTPKWKNCVQITACNCNKAGYNRRDWTKHGKLPWIDYSSTAAPVVPAAPAAPAAAPAPAAKAPASSFLGTKGYWTKGDQDARIGKLCQFFYDFFPAYATPLERDKKNLLGNLFGDNLLAWVKEFQKRTSDEAYQLLGNGQDKAKFVKNYADGNVGPQTYAILKRYGFKL